MCDDKYLDIIDMPYKKSFRYPHMSNSERAAQFAPFAALVGFEGQIRECARLTDRRIELDEYEVERINEKLVYLKDSGNVRAYITYFSPDKRKSGGAYITVRGNILEINEYDRIVKLSDGKQIPLDEICDVGII